MKKYAVERNHGESWRDMRTQVNLGEKKGQSLLDSLKHRAQVLYAQVSSASMNTT
jgi:hypothetical protein